MKNNNFIIEFDKTNGGIKSITNPADEHKMNWCAEDGTWGLVRTYNKYCTWEGGREDHADLPELVSFTEDDEKAVSVYSNTMLKITVEHFFCDNGNFKERYTAENLRDTPVFIGQDNFGITAPVNDRYRSADECMVRHCNTHIWCGHSTAYVNALRMGESEMNLGLVLTDGTLDSYSIENANTDCRGVFVLNSGFFALASGEKHTIEWELFWHKGNEDFYNKISAYPQIISVKSENFTVYEGEAIEFTAEHCGDLSNAEVKCNDDVVDYTYADGKLKVKYQPKSTGEHRFEISVGDISTYAEFLVVKPLDEIVEKRLNFIVDTQQYKNENSPLHGAFLIYDNKEKHHVFDDAFGDHNACHERIGMSLLLVKYLQTHENEKMRKALDLYIEFVKREFYEETTGDVFTTIGKQRDRIRLYDFPWVMMLFAEMYILTKDTYYTDQIVKIVKKYYKYGGSRFYPNGISFVKLMRALRESNNPDAEEAFELFKTHAENIIEIGTSYPPHEVTYEQTIVTPAVTLVSDMGALTGDERYIAEAKKHVINLERFNGQQPSFHMHEIPIRYWDDYWFGKTRTFGDIFPHYWSCLTARSFKGYYKISGEEKYLDAANKCMRNCLCLFTDDGHGSCNYVYPYMANGKRGQHYDEWANDQDFALYFAINEDVG